MSETQQPQNNEEIKPEENFGYEDPNIESNTITPEELANLNRQLVSLPADSLKKVNDFIATLYADENIGGNYRQYFRSNVSSYIATRSKDSIVNDDIYDKQLNEDRSVFCNKIVFGDKSLTIKNLEMSNENISPKTAVARFTKFINAGEVEQVPLWHSGFWVTIKPPKQKDIILLEQEIADNQIKLGRETGSLIYSNYSVIVNRIVTMFIARHITEHTVKLDATTDNLLDYINVQDLNTLILGILSSVYPKGLEYTKVCRNNLIVNDGVKLCNNILKATLDTKKLLFVNRQALSKDMLDHMAKRRPDSVSLDAVKEYQRKMSCLAPRTVKVLDGTVEVTLENPSLSKYIDTGDKWVESLIREYEATLTGTVDVSEKNLKISTIALSLYLGMYNSFVKSIKFEGDDRTYTDQETIDAMLERLSEMHDGVKPFMDEMNKYIAESAVAIVATPAYECSDCGKSDKETETELKSGFDNLVPLNMTQLFFALSAQSRENLLRASATY